MASIISTFILLVIGLGWFFRRNMKIHIPCMTAAFLMDVALLLYIEGSRHAINTVSNSLKAPENHALLLFHVTVSLLTLVLYLAQIGSGVLLYRTRSAIRVRHFHKFSAMAFLACRSINYITSFFVGQN